MKTVTYETDESRFINLYAKPNSPVLGKRFGAVFKDIKAKIEALDHQAINTLLDAETLTIDNDTFGVDDILIFAKRRGEDTVSDRFMSIEFRTDLTEALIEEGLAREIVSRAEARKELGFNVTDRIHTNQLRRHCYLHLRRTTIRL